jgi:DNA-binding NarL/FixJ family response regulator
VIKVLLATDAEWIRQEVAAAIVTPDVELFAVRDGRHVRATAVSLQPDLIISDMQIGSMGGMAVCMDLRLEHSGGRIGRVPVLLLLDRVADVFLAQRCDADGWMLKPLDSLRIRRATKALLAGHTWHEGIPAEVRGVDETTQDAATEALVEASAGSN